MIVLSILCTLLVVYILWYLIKLTAWTIRAANITANIPGPKPWPIIGNLLLLAHVKTVQDFFDFHHNLFKQYQYTSGICKFWIGPRLLVCITHQKHIEVLLTHQHSLKKDRIYNYLELIFGNGLMSSNGKEWEELRKPLNKLFTKNLIASSVGKFHEKSLIFCKVLSKYAESGEVFNIRHHTTHYSLDALSVSNFGYNLNALEKDNIQFEVDIDKALDNVYKLILQFPSCISLPYAKITVAAEEANKFCKKYWNLANEMLQGRIDNRKSLGETIDDEPTLYPDCIIQKSIREKLSSEETGKLILDFILAGSGSTAVITSNTLVLLAMYPEHQEAVYKEQVDILGEDPEVGPTWEQLSQMNYLTRVLKEALRMFCPPNLLRLTTSDVDLGDYIIPEGTTIVISTYAVHRDPQFWTHPEKFYPDHFLPEAVAARPKGAYIPFSGGPRNCPGYSYSIATMRTLISTLVRKYKFETDLKYEELTYKSSLMIEFTSGCMIKIKSRNID